MGGNENQTPSASKDASPNPTGKLYLLWHQVEDNYLKHASTDESVLRPCFYTLTPAETNTQDAPKLDGLVNTIWNDDLFLFVICFCLSRLVASF